MEDINSLTQLTGTNDDTLNALTGGLMVGSVIILIITLLITIVSIVAAVQFMRMMRDVREMKETLQQLRDEGIAIKQAKSETPTQPEA